MSAVTRSEMLAAESAAIRAGWSEEELLDLAGSRLGRAIARLETLASLNGWYGISQSAQSQVTCGAQEWHGQLARGL